MMQTCCVHILYFFEMFLVTVKLSSDYYGTDVNFDMIDTNVFIHSFRNMNDCHLQWIVNFLLVCFRIDELSTNVLLASVTQCEQFYECMSS